MPRQPNLVDALAVDRERSQAAGDQCAGGDRCARSRDADHVQVGNVLLARKLRTDLHEQFRLQLDRKSTRLNSSHTVISYAVFCLKKKKEKEQAGVKHELPEQAHPVPCLTS